MNFIIHKILQHKRRYLFLTLSLVIIQSLIFLSISFISSEKGRFFPELPYNIDNCFELEILFQEEISDGTPYSSFQFDDNKLEKIRNIKGVKNVALKSPYLRKNLHISMLYSTGNLNNIYYTETGRDFEKIFDLKFLRGTGFSGKESESSEIIITKTLADSLSMFNKNLPQTIVIKGNDKKNNTQKKCIVVGIIEDITYSCEGKEVLPIFGGVSSNTNVLVKIEDNINIDKLEEKIIDMMQPLTKTKPVVKLVALKVIIYEMWHENKRQYITFLSIIPLVLFYSFLAIFSLFWIEVKRNKTKYGILRAIGFNRSQVFSLLLKEAVFLSLISSSITSIVLFNIRTILPKTFPFGTLLSISIFSILAFVVLASIVPAIKTTHIQPAQALSDE